MSVYIDKAFNALVANLGVTFPDLLLVLIVLSCVIIFSLNVRVGLMFSTATLALSFVVFSLLSIPTTNLLYVLMITFVLLSLSFFIKQDNRGAY